MDVIWRGKLFGEFQGFGHGRLFELPDGTRYRQESVTEEPAYKEQPSVTLFREPRSGTMYLQVEGMNSLVKVEPNAKRRGLSVGAF